MSRLIIVEGNSNDKDNVRVIMVKGEKGDMGDLNHNDIIDNLTSTATDKVLSAKQGKVLKDLVDGKVYFFDTVLEMKDYDLSVGDIVLTSGYYENNDGGGAEYRITNAESETDYQEELNNGLYATLIYKSCETIKVFGGKGDNSTDNLTAFTNAMNSGITTLLVDDGTYILGGTFTLSKNLIGNNASIKMNRTNSDEFGINFTGSDLKIENLNFHVVSSNKLLSIKHSNNLSIKNCKFTTDTGRISGGVLDIYTDNKNILIENCYFETHSTGTGGIWVREGTNGGLTENVEFNNCTFIGDTIDETVAIWGWRGTVNNVKVLNSLIIRPENQDISNSFPITIGQSGITKNSGFDNCTFDIYQVAGGIFHAAYENDENLYVRNSSITTHMESLSNGIAMLVSNTGEGLIIENCKIYLSNTTSNPSLANNILAKYKNCEITSKTQVSLGRGKYTNCIFNNNPLIATTGSRGRMVELYNCVFNDINNDGNNMFQTIGSNDYYIIENSVFNYVQGDTSTRFIFASSIYSTSKPLIVKNSIFKGSVYANSSDISKGYVIGNYIDNNSVGNLSANLLEENNTVNFNY